MNMAGSFAAKNIRPKSREENSSRPESCDRENMESDESDWVRVERKRRCRRNRNDLSNRKTQCDLRRDVLKVKDFEPSDSGCGNGLSPIKTTEQRRKKFR